MARHVVAVRDTMMIGDAVRSAYRARWGEPSRDARFEVGELAIDILKWDANANPEGVALYATLGASSWAVPGRDSDHRIEFFVGILPEQDGIASALAALGLYPVREGVALDHGHTVPAGEQLWPGSRMRTFLVVRPRSDFLRPIELADGLHVQFLQAIPIFESEVDFKREHGAEALMRRWEETGVPFWTADRRPAPEAG
jgi:Suppressor of fused protein (SUFU)